MLTVKLLYLSNVSAYHREIWYGDTREPTNPTVVKILCLEIQDGDSRYFQIQNHHISTMRA